MTADGEHIIRFNSMDKSANALSSGVYFLKFQAGNYKEVKKLILLR